jgi:hypothetical protein
VGNEVDGIYAGAAPQRLGQLCQAVASGLKLNHFDFSLYTVEQSLLIGHGGVDDNDFING